MNNNEIISVFLKRIELDIVNGRWRGDCPICGGKNTFSLQRNGNLTGFHCFRASCSASGYVDSLSSPSEIRSFFEERKEQGSIFVEKRHFGPKEWPVPSNMLMIDSYEKSLQYAAINHCIEAYYEGTADLRYDVRANRVVFLIKRNGICYGATGRTLDMGTQPKWYIYSNANGMMFQAKNKRRDFKTAVVVEDCASACAVSSIVDGYALLGTNLLATSVDDLAAYDTIYVALDKDASAKAFKLQSDLGYFLKNVKLILLKQDLKNLMPSEIRELFSNANG